MHKCESYVFLSPPLASREEEEARVAMAKTDRMNMMDMNFYVEDWDRQTTHS